MNAELKVGELIDMDCNLVEADDSTNQKTSTDKNLNDSTKSNW